MLFKLLGVGLLDSFRYVTHQPKAPSGAQFYVVHINIIAHTSFVLPTSFKAYLRGVCPSRHAVERNKVILRVGTGKGVK